MSKKLEKISILSDTFFDYQGETVLISPRGSNILLFSVIDYIQKEKGTKFEIYQLGGDDLELQYMGIDIHILKSKDFNDYKKRLKRVHFKSDIVHFNNIDLFDGKLSEIITTTIHTNAFLESDSAYSWLKSNLKEFNKIVVVNSEYLERFRDFSSNMICIKNGIPLDSFSFFSKESLQKEGYIPILFPNLNSPKKNREFAIDLIKALNQESKYKFKLILTGEEEDLGIEKGFYKFVGKKKWGRDMANLYKESAFTIVPSISESCSLCSLESMACGTLVLANDIYGISDYILNKESGFLISTEKINEWVSAIIYYIENFEEYSKMTKRARNIVEKEYNSAIMANQYYQMWSNLLNDKNGKK